MRRLALALALLFAPAFVRADEDNATNPKCVLAFEAQLSGYYGMYFGGGRGSVHCLNSAEEVRSAQIIITPFRTRFDSRIPNVAFEGVITGFSIAAFNPRSVLPLVVQQNPLFLPAEGYTLTPARTAPPDGKTAEESGILLIYRFKEGAKEVDQQALKTAFHESVIGSTWILVQEVNYVDP